MSGEVTFDVPGSGRVSALVVNPPGATLGYVLAHGAGAGMRHPFLLDRVTVPMLLLQGTRDEFADLALLTPVAQRLGPRATLHLVEGGDHSFGVPKRSGRTMDEVRDELADALSSWAAAL